MNWNGLKDCLLYQRWLHSVSWVVAAWPHSCWVPASLCCSKSHLFRRSLHRPRCFLVTTTTTAILDYCLLFRYLSMKEDLEFENLVEPSHQPAGNWSNHQGLHLDHSISSCYFTAAITQGCLWARFGFRAQRSSKALDPTWGQSKGPLQSLSGHGLRAKTHD